MFKKTITLIMCLFMLFGTALVGCTPSAGDEPPTGEITDPYDYEGEFRYTVRNGAQEQKMQTDNVFTGIIKAANSSKSSDKWFVYDHEKLQRVYEYNLTTYYLFKSDEFHSSTKVLSEAETFAKQNPDGYAINSTKYVALGEDVMDGSISNFTRGRELPSGSYLYLFSKKYNESDMNNLGYAYMKFTLRFSEAEMTYHTESTEQGWNAYIFVNSMIDSPWQNCDMGLINGWENYKGEWYPFFNFNGNMVSPPSEPITKMKYNAETDTYYGADDLDFEIITTKSEYILNIKNLATGETFSFTQKNETVLKDNVHKSYMLLAASYCPVMTASELWNPRSGASFTNVIFENPKVAKYSDNYATATLEDYMPSEKAVSYGFAYAADNCKYKVGKHTSSGTYKNGAAYKAGDNYIISDISYR